MKIVCPLILLTASLSAMAAQPDLLPVRQISMELARDIAMGAIEAAVRTATPSPPWCSIAPGNVQAALRDSLAARHTLEIAERKAGMSIMSGSDSGEFRAARGDNPPRAQSHRRPHRDGRRPADPLRRQPDRCRWGIGRARWRKRRCLCCIRAEKGGERLEFAL